MRLYSVDEARQTLPRVIPILEQLREAFLQLRGLQAAVEAQARGAMGDGHLLANPFEPGGGENRIEALTRVLQTAARRLADLGIELKDPERGLIDFYWRRGDEIVFLCYELGEETITHWHRMQDGYAGRRPLP